MKIDLGCGYNKQPGYIGIDRFETPDANIVCDINEGIPLEDNTVEYVMASHFLEHVDDLMKTMKEIYRVCKHKAIVCIAAPYHNTSLNMANPYHKQVFNEHTARFFTKAENEFIPEEEYVFPHARQWALGESDNRSLDIDFRCVRMEFFYFPEYRHLSEEEKRKARQSLINVVDEILLHLVVVKEPITPEELRAIANGPLEEPVHITIRRLREQNEALTKHYEVLKIAAESDRNRYESEIKTLSMQIQEQNALIESLRMELDAKRDELERLRSENKEKDKDKDINSIKELIFILRDTVQEFKTWHEQNLPAPALAPELEQVPDQVQSLDIVSAQDKIRSLWNRIDELEKNRKFKVLQRLERIKNYRMLDLSTHVNDLCRETLNQSILQSHRDLNDYILTLGKPLKPNEIVFYKVAPKQNGWKGIEVLFANYMLDSSNAVIGFEILTENMNILRTVLVNCEKIMHNQPTTIFFDPLNHLPSGQTYYIRFIGMSNHLWGIHLYEWVKYNRLGKVIDTAFCGRLIY